MPTQIKKVRSVEEFVKEISSLRNEWFPGDALVPWCRGQERSEWDLIPKLYRVVSDDDDALDLEHEIREEFATRAPALSDYVKLSDDSVLYNWESYFVMQHYGAPTRLLDWTESSLAALYFAVRANTGNFNAAVWALDAWWLNETVIDVDEVIPPADPGTIVADRNKVSAWLPDRFRKGKRGKLPPLPVAVFPTHTMRRISAQRSCFTIHGSNRNSFGTLTRRRKAPPLVKFEIPSWETLQIRRTLAACGIDDTLIFPDLEALGRAVTSNWIDVNDSLPHEGVYVRIQRSGTHGVGLFAIRNIKKGTKIFGSDNIGMVSISKEDIKRLPRDIKKLYTDFGVLKDGRYGCPPNFNQLTPAWYLNHSSDNPNVRCDEHYDFFALRNIKRGEELRADYSKYSENA
jgi:hypothetical protein